MPRVPIVAQTSLLLDDGIGCLYRLKGVFVGDARLPFTESLRRRCVDGLNGIG
jgi:hypothetical protein